MKVCRGPEYQASNTLNKLDIGKNRQTQQKINYYLLLKATSFDPATGSSSGDEQKLEK
jgi:hypothetical protein